MSEIPPDKVNALIHRFEEMLRQHDIVPGAKDSDLLSIPFAPATWGHLRAMVTAAHTVCDYCQGLRSVAPSAGEGRREPDGYTVLIDDPSSPRGYWLAYAYIAQDMADKAAKATKGRVEPIYFAHSAITYCGTCNRDMPSGVYCGRCGRTVDAADRNVDHG